MTLPIRLAENGSDDMSITSFQGLFGRPTPSSIARKRVDTERRRGREWGVDGANFPYSCPGRALLRQLDNFWGPSGMGKGGVGDAGGSGEWWPRTCH